MEAPKCHTNISCTKEDFGHFGASQFDLTLLMKLLCMPGGLGGQSGL